MSASLNTVAGTIYEDFVQFVLKGKKQSERQHNVMIKIIVLVLGLFCILMVYVVEHLGAIFQVITCNIKNNMSANVAGGQQKRFCF